MLEFEPGLIFWTTVSFGILVVLLYKVALPPILSFLSHREKLIADSLAQAAENQKKTAETIDEYKKRMIEANASADRIINSAKEEAKALKTELMRQADKEAGAVLERARQDLAREKNKLVSDIRKEVADLVIGAAGQVLKREVRLSDNRRLIEESLQGAEFENDRPG